MLPFYTDSTKNLLLFDGKKIQIHDRAILQNCAIGKYTYKTHAARGLFFFIL